MATIGCVGDLQTSSVTTGVSLCPNMCVPSPVLRWTSLFFTTIGTHRRSHSHCLVLAPLFARWGGGKDRYDAIANLCGLECTEWPDAFGWTCGITHNRAHTARILVSRVVPQQPYVAAAAVTSTDTAIVAWRVLCDYRWTSRCFVWQPAVRVLVSKTMRFGQQNSICFGP